nr:MAG TPA: ParA [Caudoviricetes sp.]
MKMQKIAIINLKGGVGKSVTACNLACILGQMHHRRVLVMDLDKEAKTEHLPIYCYRVPASTEYRQLADIVEKTVEGEKR